MDEYLCCCATEEDWNLITTYLIGCDQSATFTYSYDNVPAFVITIAYIANQIGIIGFGGAAEGKYLVTLRGRGANYFALSKENILYPGYISEKLNLGLQEAGAIAQLLNEIGKRLGFKQIIEDEMSKVEND